MYQYLIPNFACNFDTSICIMLIPLFNLFIAKKDNNSSVISTEKQLSNTKK